MKRRTKKIIFITSMLMTTISLFASFGRHSYCLRNANHQYRNAQCEQRDTVNNWRGLWEK